MQRAKRNRLIKLAVAAAIAGGLLVAGAGAVDAGRTPHPGPSGVR